MALAAVGKAKRPTPLDLHEEHVDRITRPCELQAAAGEAARVDVGPPPVRNQPPAVDPPE